MSSKSTILLEHHLKELKLPSFLREYGKIAARCAAEGVDHPQYLLRLAELELIDRHQPMVERRIRAARFPTVKSLDAFDFPAIPSVNKALVMELARCEYVQHRENVIAVGNSGTGKTHVALGLGLSRLPAWDVCGIHHRSCHGIPGWSFTGTGQLGTVRRGAARPLARPRRGHQHRGTPCR